MHFHTATVNSNPFLFIHHGFLGNKLDILYVQLELFHSVATQQQLPGLKTNKHRAHLHSALGKKVVYSVLLFFKVAKALSLSPSLSLSLSPFFCFVQRRLVGGLNNTSLCFFFVFFSVVTQLLG